MKKHLALAALLPIAVPATALACGMSSGVPGAATFRDVDHLAALVSHDDNTTSWSELAAPFDTPRTVARFGSLVTYDSMAPAIVSSASGDRMIAFAPTAWAGADGQSVGLFDLTPSGAANVPVPGAQALNGFAAVIDAGGNAQVLVSSDGAVLHLMRALRADPLARWAEVARGDAAGCAVGALGLALDADGSLAGFCGDRPLAVANGTITVGDPVWNGVPPSAVAASHDAAGSAVFFVLSPDTSGNAHDVARLARTGGAWAAEIVASLPLASVEDASAARDGALAVAGATTDYTHALYALLQNGASWTAESAGTSEQGDRVSMVDANGTLRVLTGSMTLRIHERGTDGVWTTRSLGRLGYTTPNACDVGGALDAAPAAGPAFVGALTLLLALALRRRS